MEFRDREGVVQLNYLYKIFILFLLTFVILVNKKETKTILAAIVSEAAITSESSIIIEKEIKPSIIEEEKDITKVEMNKIVFSLNENVGVNEEKDSTVNTAIEGIVNNEDQIVLEQIYTLNVKGKGGLYLALTSIDQIPFEHLKLQVYSDSTLTKKIGKLYTIKQNTKITNKSYYLKKAGTYYLKFTYTRSLDEKEGIQEDKKAFAMTAAFIYSKNRTLQEGKKLVSYADEKKRTIYYKLKAKKDGLISYTAIPEDGNSLLSGHIQLCDEKKEPISVLEYVSNSEDKNQAIYTYYAVEQGTYYIKAELDSSYISGFTIEKVKDMSGSHMNRAKKLKLNGKEKKSVLYLSDKEEKEKWFYFRLKKNQDFTIVLNSCINGYLNIEVCNENKAIVKSGSVNFYTGTKLLKTSSKWQKGIYYIKVSKEKASLKSSGYFSIRIE